MMNDRIAVLGADDLPVVIPADPRIEVRGESRDPGAPDRRCAPSGVTRKIARITTVLQTKVSPSCRAP